MVTKGKNTISDFYIINIVISLCDITLLMTLFRSVCQEAVVDEYVEQGNLIFKIGG